MSIKLASVLSTSSLSAAGASMRVQMPACCSAKAWTHNLAMKIHRPTELIVSATFLRAMQHQACNTQRQAILVTEG